MTDRRDGALCILRRSTGTYAISLFRHENGNRFDSNFIGIPREGVGVSNNELRTLGPPARGDSKFTLTGNLELTATLRY